MKTDELFGNKLPLLEKMAKVNEKKFIKDVDTKKHPPEGLFDTGSPAKIAAWAMSSHGNDLKKAMASLSFYLNRGGKQVPNDQRVRVEKAKDILSNKSD